MFLASHQRLRIILKGGGILFTRKLNRNVYLTLCSLMIRRLPIRKKQLTCLIIIFIQHFLNQTQIIDLPNINACVNPFLGNLVFTLDDVSFVLKHLNPTKAPGHDELDARILKECADVLSPSLTRIFNCSFQAGIFPQTWKLANVIPIYKSGNVQDVRNYRPISLTCIVSKVFERCIFNKVFPHLIEQIHYL